ncbi:serine carboxypeptidase-like 33 [Hibiscus syriacus]|uniref:serine carboxypeptidase-like 33 n=1 Tax=Hibiscus syriacus TaxID=106335 RepID=UPI0019232CA0|nr:serine carboxypeptidase-like 33 [Hibiscus syriacus]
MLQVGNPFTDDNYDNTGIMDYAWSHSVIPDDLYRQTKQVRDFKASPWSTQCNDVVNRIENHGLKRVGIFAEGYDPCYPEYAVMYFNRPDVQQSIHAGTRGAKWVGGRMVEYEGLTMVTVRGAGHMVPLNKPSEVLALMHSFLSDDPLPNHR